MKYPQHWINWAESRWLTVEDMMTKRIQCEICNKRASEIHHIDCSYRGKRNDEPKNLIAVCRECHEKIHAKNRFSLRYKLHELVETILSNTKQKCPNTNPLK